RRAAAGPGLTHDGLGDERSELGYVEEAVQLRAVGCTAGRSHERVRQDDGGPPGPDVDAEVDLPSDLPLALLVIHARRAGRRIGEVAHQCALIPAAPTASSGTAHSPPEKASQRTRSPLKTGPSTQLRTIRVAPSAPRTGMTQVMQTPTPQAMASSTATCATAPRSWTIVVTDSSIPIGPQA